MSGVGFDPGGSMTFRSPFTCAVAAILSGQIAGAAFLQESASALPAAPNLTGLEKSEPFGDLFHLQQYSNSSSESEGEGESGNYAAQDVDDRITRGVVTMITRGTGDCQSDIQPEYRLDCLRIVLARTASTIERRQGYRQAARDLRNLSRKLDGIVAKYQDAGAPGVSKGQSRFRAVAEASLAQANREAAAAIDETVTKLLRSAGNSEKRKAHYSQIATAVGSTKRLLRS